jgi:hypothetical protein
MLRGFYVQLRLQNGSLKLLCLLVKAAVRVTSGVNPDPTASSCGDQAGREAAGTVQLWASASSGGTSVTGFGRPEHAGVGAGLELRLTNSGRLPDSCSSLHTARHPRRARSQGQAGEGGAVRL